jgi:Mg/Co/Ni transporter MgtE
MMQKILELIHDKKYQAARRDLIQYNPVDLAEAFEQLNHYETNKNISDVAEKSCCGCFFVLFP